MIRQRLGFFIKPHLFDQRLELEYKTLNRTKGYQFWVDSHANDFVPLLSTQFFVQSNMHNGKLILNGSRSRMNSTSNSGDSLTFSSVNQIKFCFEGSCSEPGLPVTIPSRKTSEWSKKYAMSWIKSEITIQRQNGCQPSDNVSIVWMKSPD